MGQERGDRCRASIRETEQYLRSRDEVSREHPGRTTRERRPDAVRPNARRLPRPSQVLQRAGQLAHLSASLAARRNDVDGTTGAIDALAQHAALTIAARVGTSVVLREPARREHPVDGGPERVHARRDGAAPSSRRRRERRVPGEGRRAGLGRGRRQQATAGGNTRQPAATGGSRRQRAAERDATRQGLGFGGRAVAYARSSAASPAASRAKHPSAASASPAMRACDSASSSAAPCATGARRAACRRAPW